MYSTSTNHHGEASAHGRARPGPGQRSLGYVVAIAVNVALLYLINKSPGWQAVGFLTSETSVVLGLVNASIVAGVVMNSVYLVSDPEWLRALGDVMTTTIGLVALLAIWQVWPMDLAAPWDLLARWVIAVGVAGSVIAIVVAVIRFVRALSGTPSTAVDSHPTSAPTRHA
jgi:hypothetical protein